MVLRGAVGDGVEDRVVLGDIVGIDMAGVQEAEMRGIDLALYGLQVSWMKVTLTSSSGRSRISNAWSGGTSAFDPM